MPKKLEQIRRAVARRKKGKGSKVRNPYAIAAAQYKKIKAKRKRKRKR